MRFRSGLIVLAALTMTAGCGSVEPTTQTSMLRGPTPSSGMSIPQLLAIPDATPSDQPPAGADGSLPAAPAESAAPAATPTDESLPPSTDDPASEDPLTDVTDEIVPTDQPDQTDTGAIGDPGAVNPELSALAARFSCTELRRRTARPLGDRYWLVRSGRPAGAALLVLHRSGGCGLRRVPDLVRRDQRRTGAGPGVRHLGGSGAHREDQGGSWRRVSHRSAMVCATARLGIESSWY